MENRRSYEDLKELLSYPEAVALICFNINYSSRFSRVNLGVLAGFLDLPYDKIKKMARLFVKLKMAKIYYAGIDTEIEMLTSDSDEIKDIIYEVIWEHKNEYSFVYRRILVAEAVESFSLN